jgi:hypothetical protein
MSRRPAEQRPILLNAGCGPPEHSAIPPFFGDWHQIRVDVNPANEPDIVTSIIDLSMIEDGAVQAVWSSHCIEHLFPHEVPGALAEFRRVLGATGFACIVVPDLQAIAHWIATDRLHEAIYESAAGPVTAHDMVWGFSPAIAAGDIAMAHRCGFTPTLFLRRLGDAGFAEIVLRRRANLELVALALRTASEDPGQWEALLAQLGFSQ